MATLTEATRPPRSLALTPKTVLVDVALWLMICVPMIGLGLGARTSDSKVVQGGAAVFAFLVIIARRRWPKRALIADLAGAITLTAAIGEPTALIPASVVLLFNVALRYDRKTAITAGILGLVVLLSCVGFVVSSDFFGPELLAGLAWPALAVAAGDAERSRRESIAAANERAARAEATREADARRRVIEERLHIAREVHDVIAHQIAVINVQAGVATYLFDTKPDEAKTALSTVRSSARQVLDELAGILSVLRSSDDEGASNDPAPTLHDLPAMIDSFEQVGLRVSFETVGESLHLPDSTAIAVFRTVQEALTNAHKHGDGHARVRLSQQPEAVEVTVTNRIPERAAEIPTSGFGLLGMRERAHAVGGEVSAEREPNGSFLVKARFPMVKPSGEKP